MLPNARPTARIAPRRPSYNWTRMETENGMDGVAVVTGASSGIGEAIAGHLPAAGRSVLGKTSRTVYAAAKADLIGMAGTSCLGTCDRRHYGQRRGPRARWRRNCSMAATPQEAKSDSV